MKDKTEVSQDPDIRDRKGSQPKKYHSGLSKSTKAKRDAHFQKGAKMDDDNPAAYKPAPGDARAKTKPSQHTKKFKQMYGEQTTIDQIFEDTSKGLKAKAEKSGISVGVLRKVYNRGVAAWRTGHRPGTTPEQWGMARVNSFITKGSGTWGKADKDLASKVRKEEFELQEKSSSEAQQKLMAMALQYKRNPKSMPGASDQVKKLASSMSEKDLKDFASTKHQGIPAKVNEATYKVDVDGLPTFYMDGTSPEKVKTALRRLLRKASSIQDVDRVTTTKMRSDYRERIKNPKTDGESSDD
jgi:hypothetical protein